MYEAMGSNHDNGNALVAWISSQERAQDHWRKLGHASYDDYLEAIDPGNKLKSMITLHEKTKGRKRTPRTPSCAAGLGSRSYWS